MRVSIDVDATRGVVDDLRALVERVFDEWSDAGRAAREALVSTGPLQRLDDPVQTIARLATELSVRVDLAVRVNTDGAGHCPTGRPLEYEVTDDTLDGVKTALGAALARAMQDVNATDEEGARQLHAIAESLGPYATDPDVMSGFWAAAGPDWAELLPDFLAATGSDTARADFEVYSRAFATALHDVDPPEAFTDIAESFQTTPPDPGTAWNRLALLQFGDIPTDFLAAAARANGLDILRDGQAGTWDFRGSQSAARALGLPEDGLALAFDALAGDAEAARAAISSGTGTADMLHLVYGYAAAFGSGDEVADAFGRAVEAGTGVHDEVMGRHSPEAAAFAFEVIVASAAHEDLPFSPTTQPGPVITAPHPGADVPWAVKDSLAAIAASYAPELLAGANLYEGGTDFSTMVKPSEWSDFDGLGPGFFLSPEDTYSLLRSFGEDDALSAPFDEAVQTLYEELMAAAARSDAQEDTYYGLPRTAELFGTLAGVQYRAQQDVRADLDAFDKAVQDAIRTGVTFGLGKIPVPQGQAAGLAWKAGLWAVKKGLAAWTSVDSGDTRVGELEAARLDALLLQELELSWIIIENVPEHASTLPPVLVGPDGGLREPGEIAQSPELTKAFQDWLNVQDKAGIDGNIESVAKAAEAAFFGGFQMGEDRVPK